jgi:hypothetical protein
VENYLASIAVDYITHQELHIFYLHSFFIGISSPFVSLL